MEQQVVGFTDDKGTIHEAEQAIRAHLFRVLEEKFGSAAKAAEALGVKRQQYYTWRKGNGGLLLSTFVKVMQAAEISCLFGKTDALSFAAAGLEFYDKNREAVQAILAADKVPGVEPESIGSVDEEKKALDIETEIVVPSENESRS